MERKIWMYIITQSYNPSLVLTSIFPLFRCLFLFLFLMIHGDLHIWHLTAVAAASSSSAAEVVVVEEEGSSSKKAGEETARKMRK